MKATGCCWNGCTELHIKDYTVKSHDESFANCGAPIGGGVIRPYCSRHALAAAEAGLVVAPIA
jgi:hypothetical protein